MVNIRLRLRLLNVVDKVNTSHLRQLANRISQKNVNFSSSLFSFIQMQLGITAKAHCLQILGVECN